MTAEEDVVRGAADGVPGPAPAPSQDRDSAAHPGASGRFPRKTLYAVVAAVVLALVVVTVVDRFVTTGPTRPRSFPQSGTGVRGGRVDPQASALHASLRALLALDPLHGRPAPPWTLTDLATKRAVSLASLEPHVVVLTFANANCADICTVLGTELHQAAALLARTKVPVMFVTVNTDPLDTAGHPKILADPAFSSLPNWRFVSGTVAQLNPVWKAYGISITVNETSRRVSHNDALYFVSPKGTLAWRATPFADQSAATGSFTLSPAVATRFAKGVARYAAQLARSR